MQDPFPPLKPGRDSATLILHKLWQSVNKKLFEGPSRDPAFRYRCGFGLNFWLADKPPLNRQSATGPTSIGG